jgi:predicted unusual protein kinase regulating ubiquinone biosynthesis (AarF/ABC1/UbiB family)
MVDQLDFEREAIHLKEFAKNFRGEKSVVFPKPIEKYCTSSLLIETFEEGIPISHFMRTNHPINLKLADIGLR